MEQPAIQLGNVGTREGSVVSLICVTMKRHLGGQVEGCTLIRKGRQIGIIQVLRFVEYEFSLNKWEPNLNIHHHNYTLYSYYFMCLI